MRKRIMVNRASKSGRALAICTGIKRLKREGSRFRPRSTDVLINWGCSNYTLPGLEGTRIINPVSAVRVAASKRASLTALQDAGVVVPAFTTDRSVAQTWLDANHSVVARGSDNGHSGQGITFVKPGGTLPNVPLYTQYVPKFDEYRVHVFGGSVLDIQQKRRRNGVEACSQVRTSTNGWVFCRADVACPPEVLAQAQAAVPALGLDFGAVDIGFTRKSRTATVYEVNTAPGIEGTTLKNYTTVIGGVS